LLWREGRLRIHPKFKDDPSDAALRALGQRVLNGGLI
jgi:hypothetical protein